MSKAEVIIDFKGPISFATMEMILNRLRSSKAFTEMKKPARKRLYGTVVESMDNIYKYAAGNAEEKQSKKKLPVLSVKKRGKEFVVTVGNLVTSDIVEDLKFKLDRVNQLDNEALKSLYEDVINQEAGEEDKGAGLGLITMAIRTEKDITYKFTIVDQIHSFFQMQIIIKE
ncbi:MAG: SiaB family protein kinase [Bacteroidota bacterium]